MSLRALCIKGFILKVTVLGHDGTCQRWGMMGGDLENFLPRGGDAISTPSSLRS